MRNTEAVAAGLLLMTLSVTLAVARVQHLPGCHGPGDLGWERETYMTGYGEYRRCVFHRWPEADPPVAIDWAARGYRPIVYPQQKIMRKPR
jgi:hypothetical protein